MKSLSIEKMENLEGGTLSYCGQLSWWARNPMDFQGSDIKVVYRLYEEHCRNSD